MKFFVCEICLDLIVKTLAKIAGPYVFVAAFNSAFNTSFNSAFQQSFNSAFTQVFNTAFNQAFHRAFNNSFMLLTDEHYCLHLTVNPVVHTYVSCSLQLDVTPYEHRFNQLGRTAAEL